MKTPTYLELKIGARMRLAYLRGHAAINAPQTWRDARRYGYGNWRAAYCDLSQGFNDKRPVWYAHTGASFRGEAYADEFKDAPRSVRENHGYYCSDRFPDGVARGIVGMLSHGRYIAGYELSDSGERVYFDSIHSDASEAASMADEHARIAAEAEREDNAKYETARELEREAETKLERVCECFAMRHSKRLGEAAREELAELAQSIRTIRATLTNQYANYL